MKVISVSRRTDIPAFYSKWFLNRIHAGFCHRLNPVSKQVYRVSLKPEDCLAIVFWSRNPKPLLPHLDFLLAQGYYFYFHFTINGYSKAIEHQNPPLSVSIDTFCELSQRLSPDHVQWRYDPIVLSDTTPPSYHLEQFDSLSDKLQGYTKRCYFSFVDFYDKTKRNLGKVANEHGVKFYHPTLEEQNKLVSDLQQLAMSKSITLYSCCNDQLTGNGVEKAHCIDIDIIQTLRADTNYSLKNSPTRQDCGCVESADIGVYETCGFGCSYCYATNNHNQALKRISEHDPNDTVLWRPPGLRGIDLIIKEKNGISKKSPSESENFIQPMLF